MVEDQLYVREKFLYRARIVARRRRAQAVEAV
jgi:hypothetical protein